MTEFWKDMEIGARCIRLVECQLRAKESLLERYIKEDRNEKLISALRYEVAQCEYALGERQLQPMYRDYTEE